MIQKVKQMRKERAIKVIAQFIYQNNMKKNERLFFSKRAQFKFIKKNSINLRNLKNYQ